MPIFQFIGMLSCIFDSFSTEIKVFIKKSEIFHIFMIDVPVQYCPKTAILMEHFSNKIFCVKEWFYVLL